MPRNKHQAPKTPVKSKPWDRPTTLPSTGDSDPNEIYLMVGRALTRWETVEEHLGQIFALLIGLQEPSLAAVRAFGAIATNRGRADMLGAAAEIYFADYSDPALKETFRTLMVETAGFAARRNEIAHGAVSGVVFEDGHEEFFLASPFYNTNKMKLGSGSVYAYTSGKILFYLNGFTGLYNALDTFYWRLTARVAARDSYGGTLTPAQIEALDRLLLDPTAQTHRHPRKPSRV